MSKPLLTRRQRLARTAGSATFAVALGAWAAFYPHGNDAVSTPTTTTSPPIDSSSSSSTPKDTLAPGPSPTNANIGTPVSTATFATGSCLAFAPTSGDKHLTVFLDAGHGGPDPGGQGVTESGTAIQEREMLLPVVLDAATQLRAKGFRVVVSRTTNGPVVRLQPRDVKNGLFTLSGNHRDIAARAICANLAQASALVSIHYNVGASPKNAGALSSYDAARPFSAQNKQLATLLQSAIIAGYHAVTDWNIPDSGVIRDDNVGNAISTEASNYGHLLILGPAKAGYFTTPSLMPGALIEPLFLTDPFEGTIAASTKGQHILATSVAKAVTAFLAPS